jgi:metal-sulfur cluster biosynthetic enzyme
MLLSKEMVTAALMTVDDPEMGVNIVDLGLIYDIDIEGKKVVVTMTFTSMGCPMGPRILEDVDYAVRLIPDVEEVDINLVWEPMWDPEMMTEEAKDRLGIF